MTTTWRSQNNARIVHGVHGDGEFIIPKPILTEMILDESKTPARDLD